mmetsp:Transcript_131940/g.329079  ORF Transcript_131940/g.329079 Transcript_131940/m.329079 type:complete len:519 (-) Transcript_131940:41-1597(-)
MGSGASLQLPTGSSFPSAVSDLLKPGAPAPPPVPEVPACRFGASCYNRDPEHRRRFSHPPEEGRGVWRVCRWGPECTEKRLSHHQEFAHPGDRVYRWGCVVFPKGEGPKFETLWQLFSYYDRDESGHLTREEFDELLRSRLKAPDDGLLHNSWCDAGGEANSSVNFARFAPWAEAFPLELPVGLDLSGDSRPCRCEVMTSDGVRFRCNCGDYKAPEDGSSVLCECGHKASSHRSEAAMGSFSAFAQQAPWEEEGLKPVEDWRELAVLQEMLDLSHKASDNWTRDRGCTLHGVNGAGCSLACAARNRVDVPKGYTLLKAYKNQNKSLWARFCIARSAIARECAREPVADPISVAKELCQARPIGAQPLDASCNEWRLLHGTSLQASHDICNVNFRPALAGSGATWKGEGEEKGAPLYGFGVYFAEKITKADEYARQAFDAELLSDVHAVLVVRCIGGRTNVVTTNDIDAESLRRDIFDGPNHSVLGDRVMSLKKPFREVVIYDRDQCFPEYLLLYERRY